MIIDTVEISNLGLWENLFLKFDKIQFTRDYTG